MSLKVLWYHSAMDIGGVWNSIWLAEALVKRGHQVTFVAEKGPLCSELAPRGIGFRRIDYYRYRHPSWTFARQFTRVIQEEKADVTWTIFTACSLEARLAALVSGIPAFPLYGTPKIPAYRLPSQGHIGVILPRLKEYFVGLGASPEKVHVIHGRLDGQIFRPISERPRFLRDNFDIPEGNFIVVIITRVFPSKWGAIELFVAAAEQLTWRRSDVTLVLVGGGSLEEELRRLARRVNEGRPTPALVLTGMIQRGIPEIMNEADIVLGLGSTCPLGMLCGRPTIVVGNGGYSEIVSPETMGKILYWHFNLHFKPSAAQPDLLIAQIEALLGDEARRQRLSAYVRDFGMRTFDLSVGVDALESVLAQVVAEGTGDLAQRLAFGADVLRSWLSHYSYRIRRRLNKERS